MTTRKKVADEPTRTGVKNVTKIEKYQENSDFIELLPESTVETVDGTTPLDRFFDRVRDEQGIIVRVDRLPNFAKDGKAWAGSTREFVCNIQFDAGAIDTYEEAVQKSFGGGHYRCEARGPEGVITSWTIHLANLPTPPTMGAPGSPINMFGFAPQPPTNGQGASPQIDVAKLVRDQINVAKDLLSISQSMTPQIQPVAPAPPPDPNQAPAVVELRTRMEMMERIAGLDPDKQNLMLKMVDRLFGPGEDEGISWREIMKGFTEAVLPVAIPLLTSIMQGRMAPGGVPGAPGAVLAPGQPQLPAAPVQTPVDPAMAMLAQVIQQIQFRIAQGQSPYAVTDTIGRMLEAFPQSEAAAAARAILTKPPAEVVGELRLAGANAEGFITGLQADWREQAAPPEGEGQTVIDFGGGDTQ